MDLLTLRTTLIITLSIVLLVLLWRKLRERWTAKDVPVVRHAEVTAVEVLYHPERVRLAVVVPTSQVLRIAVLDASHRPCHSWPEHVSEPGSHTMELALPVLPDGQYHVEVATSTQRTERSFRLHRS